MEESINVIIDDKETIQSELHMDHQKEVPKDEDVIEKSQDESEDEIEELPERPKENEIDQGSFSPRDIIGNPQDGVKTSEASWELDKLYVFHLKDWTWVVKEALDDPDWTVAMQEELEPVHKKWCLDSYEKTTRQKHHWNKMDL